MHTREGCLQTFKSPLRDWISRAPGWHTGENRSMDDCRPEIPLCGPHFRRGRDVGYPIEGRPLD